MMADLTDERIAEIEALWGQYEGLQSDASLTMSICRSLREEREARKLAEQRELTAQKNAVEYKFQLSDREDQLAVLSARLRESVEMSSQERAARKEAVYLLKLWLCANADPQCEPPTEESLALAKRFPEEGP